MSCPSWTVCDLTHQAIELGTHYNSSSSNGSGACICDLVKHSLKAQVILLLGRTSNSAPLAYVAWKEKWPDVWLHIDSWAVANGLDGWLGTWKELDWKISDKEVWERGMDLSEWVKVKRYLCPHVNAHQRVFSAVECFNKVDRMTHSVDNYQFLSSATQIISQWAHEQTDQGGNDGGYACGSATWASSHQGRPGYSHCWMLSLSTAEANTEYPIWYQSLVAGWLHWTASIMVGAAFCSH